jgi:hypothetical protein
MSELKLRPPKEAATSRHTPKRPPQKAAATQAKRKTTPRTDLKVGEIEPILKYDLIPAIHSDTWWVFQLG